MKKDTDPESGVPGGGRGRRDKVDSTGVYPLSAGLPEGKHLEIRTPAAWGQGDRGPAGYFDAGESELSIPVNRPPADKLERSSSMQPGTVLLIEFPSFTGRITLHTSRELTVDVVAGDNAGFTDTIDYQAVQIREDVVLLSWQEHIGTTVVHVLDFASGKCYTAVTPPNKPFMRMSGRMTVVGR